MFDMEFEIVHDKITLSMLLAIKLSMHEGLHPGFSRVTVDMVGEKPLLTRTVRAKNFKVDRDKLFLQYKMVFACIYEKYIMYFNLSNDDMKLLKV